MEHRVVFAVFTEKSDVLAEVHILEVVRDKTAVAALDALGELLENVGLIFGHCSVRSQNSEYSIQLSKFAITLLFAVYLNST